MSLDRVVDSTREAYRTPRSRKEYSDEELAVRYRDGDVACMDELFARYHNRLRNFAYRSMGDDGRAEDLVQETFIRVVRNVRKFDASKKFSTWIYTITSNLAKNELRNRSRSPLVYFQKLEEEKPENSRSLEETLKQPSPLDPARMYGKRHLRNLVEETIDELSEHHQVLFRLRELEGKSYEEISEITGKNLGTIKSGLNRARNDFRERIAQKIDMPYIGAA